MKLQDKIKSHVEKHNMKFIEICKQSDITTTALSNFLNGNSEIDFYSALRVVRNMFPDQETEIMSEYILTMQKPENLRYAMEYASFHGLTDLLGVLIGQELESKNAANREWASVYELDYNLSIAKIDTNTMISTVKNINVKNKELQVFKKYLEIKGHYLEYNFHFLPYLIIGVDNELSVIDSIFLKDYYRVRFSLVSMNMCMFNDNIENARKSALDVINSDIDTLKMSFAYHTLGLTYLYTNYDFAILNLNISLQMVLKTNNIHHINGVKNSIAFLNNYWNKENTINDGISIEEKHELIHYYIKKNNNEMALQLLSEINVNSLSKSQKGFYFYFKGLCTDSIDDFYHSLHQFNIFGNKFYANLPAIELIRRNERKSAIETALGKEINY